MLLYRQLSGSLFQSQDHRWSENAGYNMHSFKCHCLSNGEISWSCRSKTTGHYPYLSTNQRIKLTLTRESLETLAGCSLILLRRRLAITQR